MADHNDITEFQSFSERTLKYGRNLMASAMPIIVFDMVPLVKLAGSRPLNFEIADGGEIWIWRLLFTLLIYYGFRFLGLALPDFLVWQRVHGAHKVSIQNNLANYSDRESTQRKNLAKLRQDYAQEGHHDGLKRLAGSIDACENNLINEKNVRRKIRSELRDFNWRRTYFWLVDFGLPTLLFSFAFLAGIKHVF